LEHHHFINDDVIISSTMVSSCIRWTVGEPQLDWQKFIKKKRDELTRLNGVYSNILANANVESIEGRATLKDAHTVKVNGKELTAKYICIAVGGTPTMLSIPGWPLNAVQTFCHKGNSSCVTLVQTYQQPAGRVH
jgi:pyruvate/2-oxoglutarate dehydrogenase complex dihydrolipoamide dehydrogenase (E3) component